MMRLYIKAPANISYLASESKNRHDIPMTNIFEDTNKLA
jgi:hypothetical protein